MKGLVLLVFALTTLTAARGEEDERLELEPHMESMGLQEEEDYLECFRCDLGFWDACYTTETKCSHGERCYTGRGKAVDALDIKTMGCVKAEECGEETAATLFLNNTVFVMTKSCCNTPFCNSAHKHCVHTFLPLTVAFLTTWHLTEAFMG